MELKKFQGIVLVSLLLVFLALPSTIWAATLNVDNVSDFQDALNTAEANGEDDTINVEAGNYSVTTTLTYNSTENFSLTIEGEGTGSTVLDGEDTTLVLDITTTNSNADVTIRDITVQNGNNTATDYGGGLCVEVSSAQITIENSEFTGNSANRVPGSSGIGGGVSAYCTDGSISLSNNTFSGNSATNVGGGATLWTDSGTITLTNNNFSNNFITTTGAGQPGYDGGGVSAQTLSGEITLTGNVFTNNSSGDDGGGAFTYSTGSGAVINITDNEFTGNEAVLNGGGYYNHFTLEGSLTLTNNTFTDNHVNIGSGGGAHLDVIAGSVNVANNNFASNYTSGIATGGGIQVQTTNASITLTSNAFSSNQSVTHGGGAYLASDTGDIDVVNNLFNNNTAGESGGGISVATGTDELTLRNNTISGNSADNGGGISFYSEESTGLNMFNSIVWNNGSPEIANLGGNGTITVTYSDIQGGGWGNGTNIDEDPLFTNKFGTGDFYLDVGSPCLGTATATGAPSTDKDGRSRPLGGGYDMGCYEQVDGDTLPVELSFFTATASADGVSLHWRTESEMNNLGFNVYRSTTRDGEFTKINSTLIKGQGTDAAPHDYTFIDETTQISSTYFYQIEDVDFSGKRNRSRIVEVTVIPKPMFNLIPQKTALLQNYPNPGNPETWIAYQLAEESDVTLSIYDINGRLVRKLLLGKKSAGFYISKEEAIHWDGRDSKGKKVSSGMYFYKITAGDFHATKKLIIVK